MVQYLVPNAMLDFSHLRSCEIHGGHDCLHCIGHQLVFLMQHPPCIHGVVLQQLSLVGRTVKII